MNRFENVSQLTAEARGLVQQAALAQKNAYAPYSKFSVGAALADNRGTVHVGCNVENASYSATCCAERTAIFKMVADGGEKATHIAITTSSTQVVFPCGVCLQVLLEFSKDLEVISSNCDFTDIRIAKLKDLIPEGFSKENLLR